MHIAEPKTDTIICKDTNLIDGRYSLEDLIDLDRLREILENFSQATGLTTSLASHPDQEILVATGWQDACTRFHRACPESAAHCQQSDINLTSGLCEQKECNFNLCGLGLVEGATPVMIKGQHMANLFTGQVLFEKPDMERFRQQATQYGYDPGDYLATISEIPIITELQLSKSLSTLAGIASMIGEQGLANLKLKETTETLEREITVRKSVELELHRNSEHLSSILESTADGILVIDGSGKIVRTNERFLQMWHIPTDLVKSDDDDQLLTYVLKQLVDPEGFLSGVRRLYNSTERSIDTLHFKNGDIFERYSCSLTGNGNPTGRVWNFRDITEREQAKERLRKSEQKVHAAFNQTFQFMGLLDCDGTLLEANQTAIEFAGIEEKEVLGKPFWETVWWTHSVELQDKLHDAINQAANGQLMRFEVTHVAYDETLHYVDFSLKPVKDESGKVRHLVAEGHDITEYKQAVEALRESEERFRTVADFNYDWEYWVDPDGKHIYVSPSCERITGYRADEFVLNPDLLMSIIHPDDRSKVVAHKHKATETGEILPIDLRIVSSSGEERWIGHVCQSVYSDDGCYLGQRGSNRDITKRKQAEAERLKYSQELQVANRQLQAHQQELEEFTYTVSHDLKAPVVSISGFVSLLSDKIGEQLDSTAQRYLERIESNTHTMEELLRDLLELSRIGRIDEEIDTIDMNVLVDDVIAGMAIIAIPQGGKLIRLGNLPSCVARPRRIRQVLTNLLDNAVKYMPEENAGQIEIGYNANKKDPSGRTGAYFVCDNGRGIPIEYHNKIFKLFQRGPGSQSVASGTGVGLAASRRIIETHGGHLWFESEINQGATFFFTLSNNSEAGQ